MRARLICGVFGALMLALSGNVLAQSNGTQGLAKKIADTQHGASPSLRYCPPDEPDCSPIVTNKAPIINWSVVPANNSYVLPTDSIPFGAYASDPDGSVVKVTFYIDDQLRGSYQAASFSTNVSGLSAGAHKVNAVAWDNEGRTTDTGYVTFNVRNSLVTGNVDGVSAAGVISGWACSSYLPQSINVDLYLGGPAGSGTGIGRTQANQANEAAVNAACNVSSGAHRFQIPLSVAQRIQYGGKSIYVHGISPVGGANSLLAGSGAFVVPVAVRNAQFVTQNVNTAMLPGGTQSVTVQMKNNGDYTWSAGTGFKLGSQNAADNSRWGTGRVELPSDVAPGQTVTFSFTIKAPAAPGSYNFQWRMLQEGVAWFGDTTPNVTITVLSGSISASPSTCEISVGSTTCSTNITWSSNTNGAQVWVSNLDGSSPKLFVGVPNGSQAAPWITTAGDRFSLIASGFTLATVDVHAVPPPIVSSTVSLDYDELGRVIARRDAAGNVKVTYQYDANDNLVEVRDALNNVATFAYDALNRVKTFTDAANGKTSYKYDAGDRLIQIIDPRNSATSYDYDGFGQLWRQTSPDSGVTSYAFDGGGLLQSMTRADGTQTVYGYDGLNRVTSASVGGVVQRASYDSCAGGVGRLCSVSDATGTTSYSYTPEGEIAGRGFSVAGTGYSLGYAYDGLGRISNVLYPDGNKANYVYTNGLVSGVTLTSNGATSVIASAISYRGGDQAFAGWTSSNGLTNTLSYDNNGRLTGISVPNVQSLTLGYDVADRMTSITNGTDGTLTQAFKYDAVSRLTTVSSNSGNESFTYDSNGNRISQVLNGVTTSYGVSAASNRLVSVGAQSLGYDANGNLTTVAGIPQYHYDAFNRMDSAAGTNYYVNPEGQRLRKSGGMGTTYFAPDRSGPLMAEYAGGAWVDYIWLNGRLIGRVAAGQVYAVHTDQVGRPEVVTDSSRSVVWWAHNFAFDREVVTEGIKLNLGFPGQYYDQESNTWNNGFRDYRADLGRYIESDPIGISGGINTYTYVGNAPVSNADPLGLRPLTNCEKDALKPYIPQEDLDNADLHDGEVPAYLGSSYDGITRGNNIYFRPGVYDPSVPSGIALLGHELVHVGQYRQGMTWISYIWSTRHGYENSKYEKSAYAMQAKIQGDLSGGGFSGCGCEK